MPEGTLRHLSEFSTHGAANGISIGVGLTPFEIYLNYDNDTRTALRTKVRQINNTGTTVLCILFDDMRGDIHGLSNLQANVVADICAWSIARQFIVCPTYYSYDSRLAKQFGPPPKTYLQDIGRLIDPRISECKVFVVESAVAYVGQTMRQMTHDGLRQNALDAAAYL